MMFGGVPYRPRRSRFLNTRAKLVRHWYFAPDGTRPSRHWWEDADLAGACGAVGLRYQVHEQQPELYNAAFRVDVTIW
jgi:hypothetical protein